MTQIFILPKFYDANFYLGRIYDANFYLAKVLSCENSIKNLINKSLSCQNSDQQIFTLPKFYQQK
jgi:hypothetical protein